MKNPYPLLIIFVLFGMQTTALANDSTGYISTNGIQYLKNADIAMTSENLFLSKENVSVDYRFDNLSPQDISETVMFPLPLVESFNEGDFADTAKLIHSFTVTANGKTVKPTIHTRAFVYPLDADGEQNIHALPIDVTDSFKKCGLSEAELRYPWTQMGSLDKISNKLLTCQSPEIQKIKPQLTAMNDDSVLWYGQLVYSFKQTFKANQPTFIHHSYVPLVGGSVMVHTDILPNYCASQDRDFLTATKKSLPYQSMGYILSTGANWAKPIQNFTMTIERDKDEIVSYCWQGNATKVVKGNKVQFVMKKSNFLPNQEVNILFVRT